MPTCPLDEIFRKNPHLLSTTFHFGAMFTQCAVGLTMYQKNNVGLSMQELSVDALRTPRVDPTTQLALHYVRGRISHTVHCGHSFFITAA
jgi:hypothetical protein